MRWTDEGVSSDIEDRRGEGGGGFGRFGGGAGLGIGGTLIVGLLSLIFHQNLFSVFGGGSGTAVAPREGAPSAAVDQVRNQEEMPQVKFVSFVLNDVQRTWAGILPAKGVPYRKTTLVLFRDLTESGCGTAQSATGPFYCPADEKVYVDLGFFDELKTRFGAPGQFAQAYVLAHEIGHHVQDLLGTERQVQRLRRARPDVANPLSVRLELQADCYAGVWGHSTQSRDLIDQSDIEAGLKAAAAVGDDRLQRMATGHVSPESFTHGSSEQRMTWFKRGLDTGDVAACNTFQQ